MQENQKVYVKARYVNESLYNIDIQCDSVLFKFTSDVTWYQKDINAYHVNRVTHSDKIIVDVKNTTVTYELFICNFNEINNYLH